MGKNKNKQVFFLSSPVKFPCQPSLPTQVSLSVIPTQLAKLRSGRLCMEKLVYYFLEVASSISNQLL